MSYLFPERTPGGPALFFAVGLPTVAIFIELVTGWCAGSFFDPLPTFWHLLLVLTVPVVNLLLWMVGQKDAGAAPRWLAMAAGAGIAVSLTYSILLMPLLPIAIVGMLFFGLGLLPFAPLIAAFFAARLIRAISWQGRIVLRVAMGAFVGVILTALADTPASAVHLAIGRYAAAEDGGAGAVRLMRRFGDRDLLLRIAHGHSGRATGLVGAFAAVWSDGVFSGGGDHSEDARELYYRVTGEPFNTRAKPVTGLAARADWFASDTDLGGERVGQRVPGLSLAASRIDGSAAVADNLAYVEWTVEIANAAEVQNEARFTLAIPEGAVASRATLWVNGEPREASVAGRAAVRAAYQKVVSARRDPLLVTTDGAGRLLVQAFPIAPHGMMRLRIGYTAPFAVAADGGRTQALPAIVERNFEIASDRRHHVWIDGDAALSSGDATLSKAGTALRGTMSDTDLLARRPAFAAPPLTAASIRTGSVARTAEAPGLAVEQRISPAPGGATAVMIVLDGSAPMAAIGAALAKALDAIPAGLPVGLAVAADTPVTIAPAPWSAAHRRRIAAAIEGVDYRGGQDGLAMLADAVARVAQPGGRVVWIHGAQSVDFVRSRTGLEQVLARAGALPQLIRYQALPGRATTIQGEPLFEAARMTTPSVDPARDLRALLAGFAGPAWRTEYRTLASPTGIGSAHLVRLSAAQDLTAGAKSTGAARDVQIALARRLNVITPVSGAVVLENDRDYRNNDLPVPSADDVPTIPEPETWALLAILAAFAAWLWRQRMSDTRRAAGA